MNISHQSETLPVVSIDAINDSLVQAAQVACTYLESTQQAGKNRAFEVFAELAEQTRLRAASGKTTSFSAENLKQGVAPHVAKDGSAWISDLWKKLIDEESQWQEGLRDTARQLNFSYIPKLRKQAGSRANYFLEAVLLPEPGADDVVVALPSDGIRYTPEAVVAPAAWLNSALNSGVVPWSAGLRWTLFTVIMLVIVVLAFGTWALFLLGLGTSRPVTPADVMLVAGFCAAAYFVRDLFQFLEDLFDKRIVLAPIFLTPLKQDNVTLELRRSNADGTSSELAFVRYSATCPLCGGSISIHDGMKAFPDRLIGRCRRAAREHVFSFDPVLKIGRPLY